MKNITLDGISHFKNLTLFIVICFAILSFLSPVEGYKNYTVGDSLGWFDNLENPNVDYQKWLSNKTFSLGDFLIFNTDTNHSVIQTYNLTTYNNCDYDDALESDTIQWSSADPSSTTPTPMTTAVPLKKVGPNYFFSGNYDGDQCRNGQQFNINVTHGQGLPPSLESPSGDAPSPISPQSGDDNSVPETLVPSNFDHPHDVTSDNNGDESSSSVSLVPFHKFFGVGLFGALVLVGQFCVC